MERIKKHKMSKLIDIIAKYKNVKLSDEDDNPLVIKFFKPIEHESIEIFERNNSISIPSDLKELLLLSNGFSLFGVEVLPFEEMEYFRNSGLLSFHAWGDGNFDCISLGVDYPLGAIVFMNHSEDNLALFHHNLSDWINELIMEIEDKGVFLQPIEK